MAFRTHHNAEAARNSARSRQLAHPDVVRGWTLTTLPVFSRVSERPGVVACTTVDTAAEKIADVGFTVEIAVEYPTQDRPEGS